MVRFEDLSLRRQVWFVGRNMVLWTLVILLYMFVTTVVVTFYGPLSVLVRTVAELAYWGSAGIVGFGKTFFEVLEYYENSRWAILGIGREAVNWDFHGWSLCGEDRGIGIVSDWRSLCGDLLLEHFNFAPSFKKNCWYCLVGDLRCGGR